MATNSATNSQRVDNNLCAVLWMAIILWLQVHVYDILYIKSIICVYQTNVTSLFRLICMRTSAPFYISMQITDMQCSVWLSWFMELADLHWFCNHVSWKDGSLAMSLKLFEGCTLWPQADKGWMYMQQNLSRATTLMISRSPVNPLHPEVHLKKLLNAPWRLHERLGDRPPLNY